MGGGGAVLTLSTGDNGDGCGGTGSSAGCTVAWGASRAAMASAAGVGASSAAETSAAVRGGGGRSDGVPSLEVEGSMAADDNEALYSLAAFNGGSGVDAAEISASGPLLSGMGAT
jgi:hypothetical protein